MSNPNRLISLLALILLFTLAAPAQQQPADSQANQNPQQPADKNSSPTSQPAQEDQTKKDTQQPAEKDSTQAQPKAQEDQTKKDKQQAAEDKKQDEADANAQEPEGWNGFGY